MNPPAELSLSAVNAKRQSMGGAPVLDVAHEPVPMPPELAVPADGAMTQPAAEPAEKAGMGFMLPFDPLRAAESLWKNKVPCLLVGAVLGAALFILAMWRIEPHHIATAQLVKQEMPDSFRAFELGEPYKPQEIPIPVLTSSILRGRSLLERAAQRTSPALNADTLLSGLTIGTDRKVDIIHVSYASSESPQRAVEVINRYAEEAVKLTKELQTQDAADASVFLREQLARCEADIVKSNEELLRYAEQAKLLDADKEMAAYLSERANFDLKYETLRLDYETLDLKARAIEKELAKASPVAARLQKAQEDLTQMLARYTEENPLVIEQRDLIKKLESELGTDTNPDLMAPPKGGESPVAVSLYLQRVDVLSQKKILGDQMAKLDEVRVKINDRLTQLPRKTLEYALIRARHESLEATRQLLSSRQREADIFRESPMGSYRVLQPARIEDADTDARSSKKMLLGAAGFFIGCGALALWFVLRELSDSRVKTPADLRRVTRLPVLAALPLDVGADRSAQETWAFRTWTRMQSKLRQPGQALVCGLVAEHETQPCATMARLLADAAAWRGNAVLVITANPPLDRPALPLGETLAAKISEADQWLAQGSGVVFLRADESWTWTAAQRAQFMDALALWSRHAQSVVFVELPPAAQPETLLIAERLPQLLWVGAGGQQPGESLGELLATYRHAGCNLLGALLDRAPLLQPAILNRFAGTAAALLLLAAPLAAQEPGPALASLDDLQARAITPAATPADSAPAPQRRLDSFPLGPGDSIHIMLFRQLNTLRKDVVIGPDGCITYFQAQDVKAAGLTIDQLREKLNAELAKYLKNPGVIVMPGKFESRKVYILGKIVKKGFVNYDRPLTLVEAVTEAGGLETGLFMQNTVELADLGRSFLVRGAERVKVDFEALFIRGDMSQNILMQPDDYVYLPSANNNEVYVLGNVKNQGPLGLLAQSSVTSAITLAGGFTPRAYRDRVLVIRGSLDKPEALVVDMAAVLRGRAKGLRLEPQDIIYVADKPWARAEELLDLALRSFVQVAVSSYGGAAIAPIITQPLLQTE